MVKVQTALISVYDKTGLIDFARGLLTLGIRIISTGGTARLLVHNRIPVTEVSDYTGFPEILAGRVKTLHPSIHAGLLALRDNKNHMAEMDKNKLGLIDLVVVNLYPFEKVIQKKKTTLDEALENIDIGGPAMLRAGAKNYKNVAVVCHPGRYQEILKELRDNGGILADAVLSRLAVEVFQTTARYDQIIFDFLSNRLKGGAFARLPKDLVLRYTKARDLRYGENPHQTGAFYRQDDQAGGLNALRQLHGKELSFNNFLDINAALNVVSDFQQPTAVIVKHNNPTGAAAAARIEQAYTYAWRCDPVSAFGGIIGLNRQVNSALARAIEKSGFMECIVAPGYDKGAFEILAKKKNLRLIQADLKRFFSPGQAFDFKQVEGGLLLQDRDRRSLSHDDCRIATRKRPTPKQMESLLFGWRLIKHIRSNAVILVKAKRTVGLGGGQTSRVESTQLAIKKAGKNACHSFMISDGFIPKTDNVHCAARAGIKAIIQPGGSIADPDVIRAADKAGIAMVMTGVRHFKH